MLHAMTEWSQALYMNLKLQIKYVKITNITNKVYLTVWISGASAFKPK